MEYNLAGVRQRVLVDKLDDEEYDPDVVDRFINDAQRDIFNQFELTFQEKIFSGTIPAGSTMFKLPADVAQIQSQILAGPDGRERSIEDQYMPFRDFNRRFPTPANNPDGVLTAWTLHGGNMLTSAPLDDDYVMTIFYIAKPETLKLSTDVPLVPEEFSELLVLGAYKRIQLRNEDGDLAAQTEIEIQRILDQLVNKYGGRKADGPVIIKSSQVVRRRR